MPRLLSLLLLLCLLTSGCAEEWKTEKEDVSFWSTRVFDSAFSVLFRTGKLEPALYRFDSLHEEHGTPTPFTNSARFGLIANYHLFITKDIDATARAVDSALSMFPTTDLRNHYPRTYVGNLLFGGQQAYRLQQYTKANEYYFQAKKIADARLDPCERTAYNYSIAMVLFRQQNFVQSANYFRAAYALQATCAPQTTAVVLQQQEIQSNIGLCLFQLKKWDSALVYFDRALQIANENRDSLGPVSLGRIYGVVYGNKAKVFSAMNDLRRAEQFSLLSIALNGRPDYEMMDAQKVQVQLADVYSRQKRFAKMHTVLLGLRRGLDTLPNADAELGWRRLMTAYHAATGSSDAGLPHFNSYVALRDSLADRQKELANMDVTRQLNDKELALQIAMLKRNNELSRISLAVLIIFAAMVLLILGLLFINYRRKQKNLQVSNALNAEIREQKAALETETRQRHRLITEAVIRAQERERSLIGLELHDNVNQILTTVKLHNEMALEGTGDPKLLLTRSLGYLQDCINEIRHLSKRLSAPTLGKISLEESVTDLLASVNVTNRIKITQQISGLTHENIPEDVHLGLYRIIQEQVNNIIKHSGASEIVVKLDRGTNELRLSILDNGRGFDTLSKRSGIGLMNMKTRAETLDGVLELHSTPGDGCLLEVVLPH